MWRGRGTEMLAGAGGAHGLLGTRSSTCAQHPQTCHQQRSLWDCLPIPAVGQLVKARGLSLASLHVRVPVLPCGSPPPLPFVLWLCGAGVWEQAPLLLGPVRRGPENNGGPTLHTGSGWAGLGCLSSYQLCSLPS